MPRPESGLDWLLGSKFARQRTHIPRERARAPEGEREREREEKERQMGDLPPAGIVFANDVDDVALLHVQLDVGRCIIPTIERAVKIYRGTSLIRKRPPPYGPPVTPGIVLLQGPKRRVFIMRDVTLLHVELDVGRRIIPTIGWAVRICRISGYLYET